MVWAMSPLIGFFLAPILGSLSDRCNLKLGRRRPFILLLSLGIFIGLFLVPYGKDIGYWISGEDQNSISQAALNLIALTNETLSDLHKYLVDITSNHTITNESLPQPERFVAASSDSESSSDVNSWAVAVTIIGVILLDLDADICQTPARAYLLDVSVPNEHGKSLSTFTIMAGLGGCLGYALGGINWDEAGIGDFFGGNIKTVFTIVTIIFVITVIVSNTSFREVPLPEMNKDPMLRPVGSKDIKKVMVAKEQVENNEKSVSRDPEKAGLASEEEEEEEIVSLTKYLKSIVIMPKSIRILCLTNLFSWMAHLCYCLYFTSFVGEEVFGGDAKVSFT